MYSVRLKTITQLQSTVIVPPSASATATEVTHHISQDPVEHNQPELKNYSTFVSFVVLRSSSYTLNYILHYSNYYCSKQEVRHTKSTRSATVTTTTTSTRYSFTACNL